MGPQEYEGRQYVVASDLAREAGVTKAAVYQRIDRGVLASIKVFGRRLLPLEKTVARKDKPHDDFAVLLLRKVGANLPDGPSPHSVALDVVDTPNMRALLAALAVAKNAAEPVDHERGWMIGGEGCGYTDAVWDLLYSVKPEAESHRERLMPKPEDLTRRPEDFVQEGGVLFVRTQTKSSQPSTVGSRVSSRSKLIVPGEFRPLIEEARTAGKCLLIKCQYAGMIASIQLCDCPDENDLPTGCD